MLRHAVVLKVPNISLKGTRTSPWIHPHSIIENFWLPVYYPSSNLRSVVIHKLGSHRMIVLQKIKVYD